MDTCEGFNRCFRNVFIHFGFLDVASIHTLDFHDRIEQL